jgi:hypothetical protein
MCTEQDMIHPGVRGPICLGKCLQLGEGNPMDSNHNSMRRDDMAFCHAYLQVGEDVLVLQLAELADKLSYEEVYSLALV